MSPRRVLDQLHNTGEDVPVNELDSMVEVVPVDNETDFSQLEESEIRKSLPEEREDEVSPDNARSRRQAFVQEGGLLNELANYLPTKNDYIR